MSDRSKEIHRQSERMWLLVRAFLDGLDRIGATIFAVSFVGGLLAPKTSAMTTSSAVLGLLFGTITILIGGYFKVRVDTIITDVKKLLASPEDIEGDKS